MLVPVTSTQVTPPANAFLQAAGAYKRGYLGFSTLKNAAGSPAVYDLATGHLDPLSMRPVGFNWTKTTSVPVGEVWCPSSVGGNGHTFRCTTAGITGAVEPAWSTGTGTTTADGAVVWTENTPVITSAVAAGNICTGQRYMVTLFVDRNNYITGMSQASVVSVNLLTANKQMTVTPIPLGPSPQTAARICAFTPAGQLGQAAGTGITSAGPYFWIPPAFPNGIFDLSTIAGGVTVADVVNGVAETSTLINDNTTVSATFNFDDTYLKLVEFEVSPYFNKIKVPDCQDIYYSTILKRMFYAVDALPSGWYVSEVDDPETIFGATSILQVAENNGEIRIAVRDFKGITYAMKERSGHVIDPSAVQDPSKPPDPDNWGARKVWEGSGPCGPRAVDVCTRFMAYVHRSGLYVFFGQDPVLVSLELPVTWSRINWGYQQLISVTIDDDTREIHVCVPLDQATVNSHTVTLNYEESPNFDRPIHFSPYIGKEIASGSCYKWSINDIPANQIVRVERPLVSPPPGIDNATAQSQLLVASSNPDGVVSAIIPRMFNDNGMGIDSVIETSCPQALMAPHKLGGVQANIDGSGRIAMEILALRANDPRDGGGSPPQRGAIIPLRDCVAGTPYSAGGRGQNERFRLRVSNRKAPNMWFDIKWACIFAQKIASARAGSK